MKISHTLGRFAAEAARAIRNFKYELTATGIYLTGSRTFVGGVFRHAHAPAGLVDQYGNPIFGPWAIDPNRVVGEGLIHILNSALGGQPQITQYYLAPFGGNVTPGADWKASSFPGQATEFKAYTAQGRLPWTTVPATAAATLGNTAALADSTITFNAGGPYNLYGVALLSAANKDATTGVLVAATRFKDPRLNQIAGDKLALEYVIRAKDEADV